MGSALSERLMWLSPGPFDLNQSEPLGSSHDLIYMAKLPFNEGGEWRPISTAPLDRELALAVIDYDGLHALVFPCCRVFDGWVKAQTRERVDVYPTHWREWTQQS